MNLIPQRAASPLFRGALFSVLLGLMGCTSIGHVKVEGWPKLEPIEHYVPHAEMRDRCVQFTGALSSPEACAIFDFDRMRCDIYYSADFPPLATVKQHELLHCDGYDHEGETSMQAFWNAHQARRTR